MVMIAQPNFSVLTPQDYLDWEQQQPLRYEYLNGQVLAMTGGTLAHNDIAVNLTTALRTFLRGSGCKVRMADAKVQLSESGPYFYPDVVASCDERDRMAKSFIRFPVLIIEVLSPSTATFDRGDKFKFYQQLSSLQEYILIDSEKMAVDVFERSSGNRWELRRYPEIPLGVNAQESITLNSLAFSCSLASIYDEVYGISSE